ncbi:MAG: DUF2244 domain-containing protein [Methyloligellaceae bacterium]|nr:MAG: DUF2244 domain-containing protein [Alphaproteobacteria bacterium]
MAADPQKEPVKALFSAILTPHRSLSRRGFILLMAAIGGVSFLAGFAFLMMGAWPVFGFFGLDVLLIYLAFRLNYRAGRLHERVELTPDTLTVTRILPSGRSRSWSFNPYWVRLQVNDDPRRGAELALTSHGRTLIFGRFLSEEEKRDFAAALSGALSSARTGAWA